MHSRSYEPDIEEFKTKKYNPLLYFILGKNDLLIKPEKTILLIENENFNLMFFEHGHDTPYQLFKSVITDIIAENS